ncbi:MAG: Rrf2 family transcriptional regulator [Myxococcota bacterium]|nr:Rrf2 family transcriptional regulator [Myxococcota bacterium]
MKVGSRGDYGLRALVYLASMSEGAKPVQIHAIAQQQQIPEDYLRQLLVTLRTAGLVKSVRGPHGGYLLERDAATISMCEVIEALEGPPEKMDCKFSRGEMEQPCRIFAACVIRKRWAKASEDMRGSLMETTLAELTREHRDLAEPSL